MLLAERRRYDTSLQAHGMRRDQELRLRAFLRDEFSRGVNKSEAVAALHRQFGEQTVNAQTASEWYEHAAEGKAIVRTGLYARRDIAFNDFSVRSTLRQAFNLPSSKSDIRASGFRA